MVMIDMDLPKTCDDCELSHAEEGYCCLLKMVEWQKGRKNVQKDENLAARPDWCPLREATPDSTLGTKITATGIEFTATCNAKQGQDRGFMLGAYSERSRIERELIIRGLFTDDIRKVLERQNSEAVSDAAD